MCNINGKTNTTAGKVVLWSVLGTTVYSEATYSLDFKQTGIHTDTDFYIQKVLFKYLRKYHPELKLKIFLTEAARVANWEQRYEYDITSGKKVKCPDGLRLRICEEFPSPKRDDLRDDLFQEIDIKDGNNPTEIWENFNTFYNAIEENDEIYVDITHSFRSIPVIILSVLENQKHNN